MADKVPMEFSPFVGPDSLRQATHLLKNLYDVHTKRYCGYKDINGSQYEGTLENWGSEMLLEARKMLMDKPALENIFIENTLDFYFDIQYSGIIDNYSQQNMLCGVLKPDTLLSNRQYSIIFSDIELVRYPRSESYSDPSVYVDEYIHTTTTPVLKVVKPGAVVENVPLKLTDKSGEITHYYFHLAEETIGMYDPDNIPTSGTFEVPINNSYVGFPCIWMVVNLLRTLPVIGFNNNRFAGKTLLEIGTNGHDNAYMYPLFNNTDEDFDGDYYALKVVVEDYDMFYPINTDYDDADSAEKSKLDFNFSIRIKEIHLLQYDSPLTDFPTQTPINDTVIEYDKTYTKITLNNFSSSRSTSSCSGKWFFRIPQPGDIDYDGTTFKNRCYAYTDLKSFMKNMKDDQTDDDVLIPGFRVIYDDAYLHPYEGYCENAYSGIHIDTTSDYSNNGVSKKNGTIHNMGEFDGLPPYFRYQIAKDMHRAHVEMYAIRDKLNTYKYEKAASKKQTAGIILDSALPQNKTQNPGDMPIVIYYDIDRLVGRTYTYTQDDPNISKSNNMSEITFTDPYNFGNSNMTAHAREQKFVYHGNRHFSLGLTGFDPETEIGRVYIISNDSSSYENNQLSSLPKSPITFARICDIPTRFSQLINIKGMAPTLVIDEDYVRTEACYYVKDKSLVYNKDLMESLLKVNHNVIQQQVPTNGQSISYAIFDCDLYNYINLNEYIDLSDTTTVTFSISGTGHDYAVGDTFLFYIGGISVRGRVKTTFGDGKVQSVQYMYYDTSGDIQYDDSWEYSVGMMNRSNLKQTTVFNTETTNNSSTGEGLAITVEIDQQVWNSTNGPKTNGIKDGIYCLALDAFNNIWVWLLDKDNLTFVRHNQITGSMVYENAYENPAKLADNTLKDVFLYNSLKPVSNDVTIIKEKSYIETSQIVHDTINIFEPEDHSDKINELTINDQDCLFVIGDQLDGSPYHGIIKHERNYLKASQKSLKVPSYSDLGYTEYVNKSNKIHFKSISDDKQPELWLYQPKAEVTFTDTTITTDVLRTDSENPILLSDIILDDENMPADTLDHSGILLRNIYMSDEYTTEELESTRAAYNDYSRDDLISIVRTDYPKSVILAYEGTPYEYSKERIVDYLVSKVTTRNRPATYTEGPETMYRRPPVKLFRPSGSKIVTLAGEPVGPQPTGRFDNITKSRYNPNITINNRTRSTMDPIFAFRMDGLNPQNLTDLRLYDQDNNDISAYSILVIDGFFYVFVNDNWVKVNTNENTREVNNV